MTAIATNAVHIGRRLPKAREPMKNKRFTLFGAARDINVSSSGNYTANVWFWEAGERKSYWYDPQIGLESKSQNHFTRNVPKYVIEAVEAELRRLWLNGELRFFEYDRDGNERYADLRYHCPEWFARLIGVESETQS